MCHARDMRATRSGLANASHTPSEATSTRPPVCGTRTCAAPLLPYQLSGTVHKYTHGLWLATCLHDGIGHYSVALKFGQ